MAKVGKAKYAYFVVKLGSAKFGNTAGLNSGIIIKKSHSLAGQKKLQFDEAQTSFPQKRKKRNKTLKSELHRANGCGLQISHPYNVKSFNAGLFKTYCT